MYTCIYMCVFAYIYMYKCFCDALHFVYYTA